MYGFLHQALTAWLRSQDGGEQTLKDVYEQLNITGSPDDFFRHYSDTQTMLFLDLASKATGLTLEECMYEAGKMSMGTFVRNGYEPVLRTLGKDFFTMLTNLDSLHDNFLSAFPEMKVPSLRPERNPDDSMSIHYYSQRRGLAPFMMGALKSSAKMLYDLDIDIHHRLKRGKDSDHDVFHVFMDPRGFPEEPLTTAADEKMATAQLNAGMTNRLFPWHFAVDKDMKIVSLGKHLASRMKKDCIGMHAEKLFRIARPIDATWDFEDIKARCDKPFLFVTNPKRMLSAEEYAAMLSERQQRLAQEDREQRHSNLIQQFERQSIDAHAQEKEAADDSARLNVPRFSGFSGCPMTGRTPSGHTSATTSAAHSLRSSMDAHDIRARALRTNNIKLHGEVVFDEEQQVLLFVGNPLVQSTEELDTQGIDLADMPIHCHGREVLYSAMCQAVSASNSNEVEAKLADLDRSMAEVHSKKEQIDGLLHSILPPVVADSLARGEIPAAEQYEHVTVLFSDIAGFTNISSEVPSLEVMDMLHELFVKFDDLADQHGCYKVETIGDAYMVTAGCPEECEDHALRIARLAIDMVRTAQTVLSPLDGEPLRIRVGLHSGPLMAGVVGRARPRYCLFGDTVNVASRMESNGLPGCIQVTYRFLRALPPGHDFVIASRGHITIKGKGTMKTFLLLGRQDSNDDPLVPTDDDEQSVSEDVRCALALNALKQRLHQTATALPTSANKGGKTRDNALGTSLSQRTSRTLRLVGSMSNGFQNA
ncbi:NO-insensitive guanylyl cyclase III [Salpingoeca rosetta]|uniref:guanylate cyclase n=1 Tax=Salpingoeca rosetta (strain ATCC 50818 / BSB-021) TaxID=946362 RepID=F2TZ95_SALR5|nr:NO-insensitive guanylyl cyclase III [Salpingoeca rosetta]EGD78919.1 NO-insensitive guanylyl cyclase III [Salpingoeca rosetta]|eukprot:XP_004997875.1 NO-insensitive guanylyl cyclase III [Salpingoeca rosetta]